MTLLPMPLLLVVAEAAGAPVGEVAAPLDFVPRVSQAASEAVGVVAPVAGPAWAWLLVLLPLLASAACGWGALAARDDGGAGGVGHGKPARWPWLVTVGSLGLSFVVAVGLAFGVGGGPALVAGFDWISVGEGAGAAGGALSASFALYADGLSVLWMLFVTGLACLIAVYAGEYMSHEGTRGFARFFCYFSLFVASMALLVLADNLVLLYLGWEGVGLCSYLLVGFFYRRASAVAAAKKAFIVNRVGDLGLALGLYAAFRHFGTLSLSELVAAAGPYLELAASGAFEQIPADAKWIAGLLLIGAFGKSAQFPLYVWLPDAMEGPTPVSALIHAATMVTAGVYLVARTLPLFTISPLALAVVAWSGALTALLGATIAMAQFDIKRIMAYSTVSQLGYMFCALGVAAAGSASLHVLTHAFFKALLFLACGAVMHGFAGQLDLRRLSGVRRLPGWTAVTVGMLVGCLALSGFPVITGGYWSKDEIMGDVFASPAWWNPGAVLGWVLLATAGLTAYYAFRVFFRVFCGPVEYHPGPEHHADHEDQSATYAADEASDPVGGSSGRGFKPHAPGLPMSAVLWVLVGLTVASAALPFVGGEHGAVGSAVRASTAVVGSEEKGEYRLLFGQDPHKLMYYISAVVAILGIAVAWWLHLAGRTEASRSRADGLARALGPLAVGARGKWFVDEAYDAVVRLPLLATGFVVKWIDAGLIDGLVRAAGRGGGAGGRAVGSRMTGDVQGYAAAMIGGVGLVIVGVLVGLVATSSGVFDALSDRAAPVVESPVIDGVDDGEADGGVDGVMGLAPGVVLPGGAGNGAGSVGFGPGGVN